VLSPPPPTDFVLFLTKNLGKFSKSISSTNFSNFMGKHANFFNITNVLKKKKNPGYNPLFTHNFYLGKFTFTAANSQFLPLHGRK
jgi:hypothetical protein